MTFDSVRPLLDCSRDIRVAAAGQIDDLLAAIEGVAQERLEQPAAVRGGWRGGRGASEDVTTPVRDAPGSVGGAVKMRRKITGRTAR